MPTPPSSESSSEPDRRAARRPELPTPPSDSEATTDPATGSPSLPPTPPSLPRFPIEKLLGTGRSAAVYQACDQKLRRTVAVKVLHPHDLSPALRERFLDEARAVAKLDHPYIVKLFDVGDTPPDATGATTPYLALDFIGGGTLTARLNPPWAPRDAAAVIRLLALAMAHAHSRGIVHRDLKPDNILLAEDGTPRITDFGLARQIEADRRLTNPGVVVGTPHYMAPEQADGQEDIGPKADVWALGVILYRLLTGKLPFDVAGMADQLHTIRHDPPTPPREIRPEVPAELERICLACLAKDAANRPTAGELAVQLQGFLTADGLSEPGALATGASPSDRVLAGRLRLMALAGVVLAAAAGLAWWATRPPDETGAAMPLPSGSPIRITAFRVRQFEVEGNKTYKGGVLSRDATGEREQAIVTLPFAAHVQVEVEFSEPVYAYLISCNANGESKLRWPVDAEKMPNATVQPPRVQRVRDPDRRGPTGGAILTQLDDEPRGGLQAYAVVLSRESLPSYKEWIKGRALPWGREADWQGAWLADAEGVYPVMPGQGALRGKEVEMKVPPLLRLVQALRTGGQEVVVEVLAVSVDAKEKQP